MVEVAAVGAVPAAAAPVNPGERIDAIDVLRGIALFGVLAINVVNEFRVSIFEEFLPAASTTGTLDRAVQTFLTMAVELKAMALFSLLFGIGMAIQFERLAPDPRRGMLLVRRLAILLVIGLAHLFLIWNGDILTEYSLAGFIVLPLLWGPRWLLAARRVAISGALSGHAAVASRRAMAHDGIDQGSCRRSAARLWHRWISGDPRVPYRGGGIHPSAPYLLPRTIALFLFGMLVWRTDVVRRHRILVAVAIVGIVLGAALTVASEQPALLGLPLPGRIGFSLERLATLLLAIGYAAAIIGFVSTRPGMTVLAWVAPAGTHGFYELPGAIRHLRLDFLRLWSRPVRPRRRRHRTRDRCLRVCRRSGDQRPMAAVLSVRPHRVAVAQPDVRHGAAFAHPPSHPFGRVRVADERAPCLACSGATGFRCYR